MTDVQTDQFTPAELGVIHDALSALIQLTDTMPEGHPYIEEKLSHVRSALAKVEALQ